jgi:iron complex transport system permease protein
VVAPIVIIAFIAIAIGSMAVGPVRILPGDLVRAFASDGDSVVRSILFRVRLPRIALAIFAGSSLALVGACLQGVLLNPLADPYILGISGGAAFGAALAIVAGWPGSTPMVVSGFCGALAALVLVYSLARFRGRMPREVLLLAGVVVNFFFSALVMLLMATKGQELHRIIYLLMGHLGTTFSPSKAIGFAISWALVLVVLVFLWSRWRDLNVLSLGEEQALSLGVQTDNLRRTVFVASSVVVGAVVAFCGSIGFIGLMVPHLVRMLIGPNHRTLLPLSFLVGAMLLLIADDLARTVALVELPVGVVTALFGVPFFAMLLRRRGRCA